MRYSVLVQSVLIITLLVVATLVIAAAELDRVVSSCFYIGGKWPVGELFPWRQLYVIDRVPAVMLALAGVVMAGLSYKKLQWQCWRKAGIFLVLFLIAGPGLVVNSGFKDGWGRPRPREIVQFGGTKEFRQPWQKGVRGDGRSFPSGHSSAAFFMIAPFFVYRRHKRRVAHTWLVGGIVFGLLMSIARLTQGGHFLSDNMWSLGIVYLIGLWLAALMKLDEINYN